VLLAALAAAQDAPGKKYKEGEYEPYNQAVKDINSGDFTRAIADLDAWKLKFPESDYADERVALYVQAYAGANQAAQSMAAAAPLIARDLNNVFPGPAGQSTVIRVLYAMAWATSHSPNPAPGEVAAAEKAARQLIAYDQRIAGVTAEQWATARADMREKGTAALLYIAMLPGIQAMSREPADCAAADAAYSHALGEFPEKTVLSYELGRALNCEAKQNPERLSAAVYEFERAAVVDPALGDPKRDAAVVRTYADNAYMRLHGSEEGLEELKRQVLQSPLPPADFRILTAAEIASAKPADPQLALWSMIKTALAADGTAYFENQLKDAAVPQLRGTLLEARPACHPKELLIAVPLADIQSAPRAEIRLKLDKALSGKPELNTEVRWEGVPSAFTADPFLLTMDAETAKIHGLKIAPCTVAPPRRQGASIGCPVKLPYVDAAR
jgi:hypothetical protein